MIPEQPIDTAIYQAQELLIKVERLNKECSNPYSPMFGILSVLEGIKRDERTAVLAATPTYKKLARIIRYDDCIDCRNALIRAGNYWADRHKKQEILAFVTVALQRGRVFTIHNIATKNKKNFEHLAIIALMRMQRYQWRQTPMTLVTFERSLLGLANSRREIPPLPEDFNSKNTQVLIEERCANFHKETDKVFTNIFGAKPDITEPRGDEEEIRQMLIDHLLFLPPGSDMDVPAIPTVNLFINGEKPVININAQQNNKEEKSESILPLFEDWMLEPDWNEESNNGI